MNLADFKVNDVIKIVISDCVEGEAVVIAVDKKEVVCRWIYCSLCYDCQSLEDSELVKVTEDDIKNNIVDELELLERPREGTNNYLITENQIEKLKGSYIGNKEELETVEQFIEENGITDYGLTDVTESFEQGYNNALQFVFSVLGIEYK